MTCEQFRAILVRGVDGTLLPQEAVAWGEHYNECPRCRAEADRKPSLPDPGARLAARAAGQGSWLELTIQGPDGTKLLVPDEDPTHPGFLVYKELGRGGMGVVLKAFDRKMERLVALKLVSSQHLQGNSDAKQRLVREAKIVSKVEHPDVVRIYDVLAARGFPLIVMQFVPGLSLTEKLVRQQGPLPLKLALAIAIHVAGGLAALHDRDLVHRDVKPDNVRLHEDGRRAMITDFGLTFEVRDGVGAIGEFAGSPHHMAPEQTTGQEVNKSADLFSLGVVLYQMLTGRLPFEADTLAELLRKIREEEPAPVCEHNPAVSARLGALVTMLLDKTPEARGNADEVVTELKRIRREQRLRDAGDAVRGFVQTRAGKSVIVAILVVLVAIGGWGGWRLFGSEKRAAVDPPLPSARPKILFILPNQFWGPEYYPVRDLLEEKGFEVVVAAENLTSLKPNWERRSEDDKPVIADLRLEDVKTDDYVAVIVPGGNSKALRPRSPAAPHVKRVLEEMVTANKCVGGIGTGVLVLASAGVLNGRETACHTGDLGEARKHGALAESVPLRVSPPVITARSGGDKVAFVEALVKNVSGKGAE